MPNSIAYNKLAYATKLRARLDYPTCWNDVSKEIISDDYSISNGYWNDTGALQTGTRGTAYGYDTFNTELDTLTINATKVIPLFVDEADRAQQTFADKMELASIQGKLVNEYLETYMLSQHALFTDFGATDLANTGDDDSTAITISATNIDDLIRAMKRKIYSNNGVDISIDKGLFTIWRPNDFMILEGFAQANGYNTADMALKNGISPQKAFGYMGMDHYLSNSHTANHLMAGVKGIFEIGILRHTYGKAKFLEDPGSVSGLGIVTRLDYGCDVPDSYTEMVLDVNAS